MRTVFFLVLAMLALFDAHSQNHKPTRDVEVTDEAITVTYNFNGATIQQDPIYEDSKFWKIYGFGLNETAGEPAIPYRNDVFALGKNTSFSVDVIDSVYTDSAFTLSPARPVLNNSDNSGYSIENVPKIKPYEGFYPVRLTENGVQYYRGQGLLKVTLSPIQYDFMNKTIRVYSKIKYRITLQPQAVAQNGIKSSVSENRDPVLQNVVLNNVSTQPLKTAKTVKSAVYDTKEYLIISNPWHSQAVNKFADWKRTQGKRVHIAMKNLWTTEEIKSIIKEKYNSLSLDYVLMIGDEYDIPSEYSIKMNKHVTDLYYGCMDGEDDYTPDVYMGRILASNSKQSNIIIDKIINYEKNPTSDEAFYNRGLNCAYFEDKTYYKGQIIRDGYADYRFAQTSEEVRNYLMSFGKNIERVYCTEDSVNPLYWNNGTYSFGEDIPLELQKPQFKWNGNAEDIKNCINEGVFYVLHRDHGEALYWAQPHFEVDDIDSLSNGNKLPVVFSINCLTGKFDNPDGCFAERFLKKENGGCVAIFAATEKSLPGYNDALAEGMFDAMWPVPGMRPVFPKRDWEDITTISIPVYELGQILNQAMMRMDELWGKSKDYHDWERDNEKKVYAHEIFHCFGDPSMEIYTSKPMTFQEPIINCTSNGIHVETVDGDARISFYTPREQKVDSYYGECVNYTTSSDSVVICLTRHNYRPYITTYNKTICIQCEHIATDNTLIGRLIKVGRNVTSKKPQGDAIFTGKSITNLNAREVELHPGTTIDKGATLNINTNY